MSRVFLVEHNPRFVVDAAAEFGEIRYLTSGVNPLNLEQCVAEIHNGLIAFSYKPEEDFICMTGTALLIAVLLGVVVSQHDTPRLLLFDARESTYRIRKFNPHGR